ncbi:tetratricopeptide repeat protein [Dongia sp.]|uniref:tetratricopeptide repeat protein n=1 Tax=Dongia sp. TaxID=1977262 RepID=UPI0035B1EE57
MYSRRHPGRFLAALACFLFLAQAALAKVADDRIAVPREPGSPMGAVGMVLHLGNNGAAIGTGFLVSPCHVLTAAHVVAEPEGISADQVMLFFAGSGEMGPEYKEARSFAALSPARPVVWGESHDFDSGSTADRRAAWLKAGWDDWALLKLDNCLGDEGFGYLKLLPVTTSQWVQNGGGRPAVSVGLPADHDNDRLTVDPKCTLLGQVDSTGWQHDCTTLPGNSGGPILAAKPEPGEDWPRVLAITVIGKNEHWEEFKPQIVDAGAPDYLDLLPTAVPVSAFLPRIAPYLPKDPVIDRYLAQYREIDRGYDIETPKPAIADLTKALEERPGSPLLLTRRGLWLEVAEDQAAALVDYSAALRADPNFAPALYARALLRGYRNDKLQGDAKASQADLDLLIRRFPDSARLRIARGSLLYGNYDYRSALGDYDAALKLDPGNVSARLTRANARVELGDMEGAGEDYDAAIKARPDAAYLLVERANYYMRAGRSDDAFDDIATALEIEPDMPSAVSARAILRLDLGEAEAALADSNLAIALDNKPSGGRIALRGTIRHIMGDLEGAIADYAEAGKLDPTEPFDPLLLYIALCEAGRPEEGREALRALLKRWPTTEWPAPLALYLLGESSEAELKKVALTGTEILRKYQDFDWHFYLGATAMSKGDKKKARDYFQHVVDTGMSQFLEYNIARIYLERLGGQAYLKTN